MKAKALLIAPLFLIIPFLFGYSIKTNSTIVKTNFSNDTIIIPQKGTVYMYRIGKAVGAVIKSQVKINGKEAGALGNKSFFEWELEPGKYIFTSYTKESNPVIEIDVKPNQKYYIRQDKRIGLTNDGRVTLKLVNEATGASEVGKLRKVISNYVD